MLDIKTEDNGPGSIVHSFVARGTKYTIFQRVQKDEWEVWSAQQSRSNRVGNIRIFDSLKQLAGTNKTFRTFAEQVGA